MKADKADLLRLMQLLPADAAPVEIVDEAMYKLVLSYTIDKASLQIAEGKGIPHEEVKRHIDEWLKQPASEEQIQEKQQ